jgi:uncharacterized membrane protein
MGIDIRIPIGGLFMSIGVILLIYGLATFGQEMYARSLHMNINVWWGGVMLVFGLLMLHYGRRAMQRSAPPPVHGDTT